MRNRVRWMFPILSLFLSALAISFYSFIGDIRDVPGEAGHADAIVVLTGGSGRIEEGLRLFREGKGEYLILSGVESKNSLNEIFPRRDLSVMVDTSKIILDVRSRSTLQNAASVKMIAGERSFKSLIVVTSNYHMKRAVAILDAALEDDVKIYRHPVIGPNFRVEGWWRDGNSLKLVLSEFVKYVFFKVKLVFEG